MALVQTSCNPTSNSFDWHSQLESLLPSMMGHDHLQRDRRVDMRRRKSSIPTRRRQPQRPGGHDAARVNKSVQQDKNRRISMACENCRDRKIKCTGPSRSDGSCTGCINKSSHYPDCQFMRVQCTELIFVEPGKSDSRAGEPVTYESVRAILGKASKNGEDDRRSSVCQEERYLSSSPQHSAPPDSTEVAPVCSPPGTWAPIVPTYAVSSCPVSASHLAEYTPSYNTYEERVPSAIVADQSERRLPSLMSSLNGDLHVQNWTSQGPNQSRTTTYHPSPWTRQILPDISVASAWDSPLRALHYRSQPIMLHPLTNTSAPSTAVAESYSPCKTSFCLPAMSAATLGSDTMVAPIAPMGYGWRSGDWSAGQWMEQDATADADVMSQGYEPAMCGAFHAGSGSAVGQAGWREV